MEGFQEAYAKALNYLSCRPRTIKAMQQYLRRKEYSEEIIRNVIDKLAAIGYLNDYDYASRYIEITAENKAMSQEMIKLQLKHKGVPPEVIKEALNTAEIDEFDHCIKILKKKVKEKEYLADNQQRIKLKAYLFRKGFHAEIIHKAIVFLNKELNGR